MTNINDAGLSARTSKALEAAGYKTIEEVAELDDKALKEVKGLGPKSLEEVQKVTKELGAGSQPLEEAKDQASSPELPASDTSEPFAKAGKRSKKATEEEAEKEAKEERKARIASGEEEVEVKKGPAPKVRSKLERRHKKYRKAHEQLKKDSYSLAEAVDMAIKTSTTSFDSTIDIAINLNVDPKQADQNIRSTIVLPHGTGKSVKVAVFAPADQHKTAKEAGADIVGEEDFLAQLDKEIVDFDVLISTPEVMAKLGKYAKMLGPKGLMPNPKSGTVTKDVAGAVKQSKAGKVEYRVDSRGIVHLGIGKASFGADKVTENAQAVIDSINANKPASIKEVLIARVSVSSTMGPGVRANI